MEEGQYRDIVMSNMLVEAALVIKGYRPTLEQRIAALDDGGASRSRSRGTRLS
jgi:hypothetical protein